MGGTYQIFHPTFFSRVGLDVLILHVLLYVQYVYVYDIREIIRVLPRAAGAM